MATQSRHSRRMKELAANKQTNQISADEGKWKISFVFDGKEYKKSHQLSQGEIKHMKDLCAQFGDEAAQQVIWRAAIKGVGTVSENIMAQAGLDYVKKHYQGPLIVGIPAGKQIEYTDVIDKDEVHDIISGYLETIKPLPDEKAFSADEKEKIEQQIMGEGL